MPNLERITTVIAANGPCANWPSKCKIDVFWLCEGGGLFIVRKLFLKKKKKKKESQRAYLIKVLSTSLKEAMQISVTNQKT